MNDNLNLDEFKRVSDEFLVEINGNHLSDMHLLEMREQGERLETSTL